MLSYLKLVRFPNLLMIGLVQYMTRFFVIRPLMLQYGIDLQMGSFDFALLVFSFMMLAAAGNIINDYYDRDIDAVNKPGRNMLLGKISPKSGYRLSMIFNVIACIAGIVVAIRLGSYRIGIIHIIIALALYFYSLKYKRMFITGNLVVSLVTCSAILIVWLYEFYAIKSHADSFTMLIGAFGKITAFVCSFAALAFMSNFVREVIKDAEDVEGDRRYGCRTIPIKLGQAGTRRIVVLLTLLTMLLMGWMQYRLFVSDYKAAAYFLLILQLMYAFVIIKSLGAKEKSDWHFISNFFKILLLAGILATQTLVLQF